MDIDPNNLGPVVYKEEQVITKEDLSHFLSEIGTGLMEETTPIDFERAKTAIAVLSILLDWISNNKKRTVGWFREE